MNWHEYFTYEAETGNLIWKERSDVGAHWNAKHAGKIAGVKVMRPDGRRATVQVYFNNKPYRAHRIILEMHDVEIPEGMIPDHIDGDPWNNKRQNLRVVTPSQNSHNAPKRRDNTSGHKGVMWCARTGKWRAAISANKTRWALGEFASIEEAVKCRKEAERVLHGEHARGA